MTPVIITVAGTGAELTKKETPFVPLTPDEILKQAIAVDQLGAHIWHLHVRDQKGKPTCDPKIIKSLLLKIKKHTNLIVQVSTGGAVTDTQKDRLQTLVKGLDMGSLTMGSINFGDEIFANPASLILKLYQKMEKLKIQPEFEIFDVAMLEYANYLIHKKILKPPFHFNFVLGGRGFLQATEANLDFLISKLPKESSFTVSGIGKAQFIMAELAICKGGHVRVGLEDNIYLDPGKLAQGNAELVEKVLVLAKKHKRIVASSTEARRILSL